jgi:hypothetical protein
MHTKFCSTFCCTGVLLAYMSSSAIVNVCVGVIPRNISSTDVTCALQVLEKSGSILVQYIRYLRTSRSLTQETSSIIKHLIEFGMHKNLS